MIKATNSSVINEGRNVQMCPRKPSDKTNTVKEQPESFSWPNDLYESPLIEERYEMINGIRYDLSPSPGLDHQLLATKMSSVMHDTCQSNGIVVVAPMDVHLDEDNVLQPDVIYISNENMDIVHGQKIEGPPDLVVEILSPRSGKHDKIRKKAVYEHFGIPEFWVVDPPHETVDQFVLDKGNYHLHGTFSEDHLLISPKLACVHIDLKTLFQEKIEYRQ
ncbi:Uma2 family endonuclease [Salicibibacter cibi]|uniref:Uma2 family endonuclease n=1 Tax=Salicibibacter cibi TaxID=2743001 RepID=A0A7T6Z8T6_9BACI|nr:Uma2 family endonuclease [Salicibibacter cibi]QQK78936.1 Uma2 family endonuclease [Salicibibacter cibi]